jgi:hypothetical protein
MMVLMKWKELDDEDEELLLKIRRKRINDD